MGGRGEVGEIRTRGCYKSQVKKVFPEAAVSSLANSSEMLSYGEL